MARPLRINRAGVWFHVVARGTDRKDIFQTEADRRHWLELLGEFVHRFRLRIHAYVMGLVLGSREFLAKAQKGLGIGREQPQSKSLRARPQWKQLVAAVESVRGMEWEELQSQRGDWGRDLAWHLGQRECGLRLRELGELSGGVDYATVSAGARRIDRRLSSDKALAQKAREVERQLK